MNDQQQVVDEAVERLKNGNGGDVAVFTGAGISCAFGYPLTRDLLPRMLEWEDDDEFLDFDWEDPQISAERRKTLAKVLRLLLPGIGEKDIALPLVTTLLSQLDHAILHRHPLWAEHNVEGLRKARQILDHAIFDTLQEYVDFTPDEAKIFRRFCEFLKTLKASGDARDVGVITTNYDIAADWAVLNAAFGWKGTDDWTTKEAREIDFGVEWLDVDTQDKNGLDCRVPRPVNPLYRCFKLHGSTNWLRCPLCQQIYINPIGSTWFQAFRAEPDRDNTCSCSDTRLESHIVSPSFVRQMDDRSLLEVWNNAYAMLCRAEHWIIMGYSLPEEDVTIRALLTRALHFQRKRPLKVTVVQRSDNDLPKYKTLFGNHGLKYFAVGLEGFLDAWEKKAAAGR